MNLLARLAALERRPVPAAPSPAYNALDPPAPAIVAAERAFLAALHAGETHAAALEAADRAYETATSGSGGDAP